MCRFVIYIGNQRIIKNIVWLPEHSLIKQSFTQAYTPGCQKNVRDHDINVDGFGIDWYDTDKRTAPFIYKNTKPSWDDTNFLELSEYISTKLLFFHIRAIKPLCKDAILSEQNCHPFRYGNFMWMHNGTIPDWINYKRQIIIYIDEDIFKILKGNTDSEYMFALFLHYFKRENGDDQTENIKNSLIRVLDYISTMLNGIPASMNIAVTNGNSIVCSRYINSEIEQPPSLYFSRDDSNIIIASEPTDFKKEWTLIKKNAMVVINNDTLNINDIVINNSSDKPHATLPQPKSELWETSLKDLRSWKPTGSNKSAINKKDCVVRERTQYKPWERAAAWKEFHQKQSKPHVQLQYYDDIDSDKNEESIMLEIMRKTADNLPIGSTGEWQAEEYRHPAEYYKSDLFLPEY